MIQKIRGFCKLGFPSTRVCTCTGPTGNQIPKEAWFVVWWLALSLTDRGTAVLMKHYAERKGTLKCNVKGKASMLAKVTAFPSWVIAALKGITECVWSFFREESWLFHIFQNTCSKQAEHTCCHEWDLIWPLLKAMWRVPQPLQL